MGSFKFVTEIVDQASTNVLDRWDTEWLFTNMTIEEATKNCNSPTANHPQLKNPVRCLEDK